MSKRFQFSNEICNQKRKTPRRDFIPVKSNFKKVIEKPFEWVIHNILFSKSIVSLGLALSLSIILISVSSAQGGPAFIR